MPIIGMMTKALYIYALLFCLTTGAIAFRGTAALDITWSWMLMATPVALVVWIIAIFRTWKTDRWRTLILPVIAIFVFLSSGMAGQGLRDEYFLSKLSEFESSVEHFRLHGELPPVEWLGRDVSTYPISDSGEVMVAFWWGYQGRTHTILVYCDYEKPLVQLIEKRMDGGYNLRDHWWVARY